MTITPPCTKPTVSTCSPNTFIIGIVVLLSTLCVSYSYMCPVTITPSRQMQLCHYGISGHSKRRILSSSSSSPSWSTPESQQQRKKVLFHLYNTKGNDDKGREVISKEAEQLLAKAKEIRDSLEKEEKQQQQTSSSISASNVRVNTNMKSEMKISTSPFNVNTSYDDDNQCQSIGYRLYIDIGREDGTWMDPRWGASGKRIEFTIDTSFLISPSSSSPSTSSMSDLSIASEEIQSNMVKDNLSGKSSIVRVVQSAPKARLRSGFDEVNANGGGYRIDNGSNSNQSSNTLRFYLSTDGTEGRNEGVSYGDISIPKGNLYFSLPCFGNNVKQLSTKEGIVTVRKIGWHTGWRREESRIVGVFRAVPIDQAKKRDGF